MNFKKYITTGRLGLILLAMIIGFSACTDDLVKTPTNDLTADKQFQSVAGYKQSLASIYSNMIYGSFLRQYWGMQEYTTDEAVSTWNDDGGNAVFHQLAWSADAPAITYVYSSMLMTITYCNNYLNESTDAKIASRGFTSADVTQIKQYTAEVRYLRAYCYWVLMDLYGNPPFPTPDDLGFSSPKQIKRADLFNFIESELKDIESQLADPRTNERGRPDKAAAWALLSRMYLNGTVYTGNDYYTQAITYCNKIISAGYSLESHYSWLMLGDNNKNTNEFIFTLNYDNTNETWNGTNFMALGAAGIPASINGLSGSWGNFRMTQQIPALFPTADTTMDKRAEFYTTGQNLEVNNVTISTDGYSAFKYRNVNRDGSAIVQNNSYNNLSDIDFPVFRLAEIYLTYAEAVLRGGSGGSAATALSYVNKIRGRAYASDPSSTQGNIQQTNLTLDFLLKEKAREFYWEAQRRTDLVRYNKLTTSDYLWAWKGNTLAGKAVDSKYNLFPIPTSDLLANPNLKQNDNY
ncbi:RagB/SusD family nutrient uptake outer membrane protein [Parabacteroides sp. FAFU027]|uniref:RagB/SusD family nutrient uptake outer membrane protein n=1 Tax=Parabacteroides sp. FAFU027 TaxID=2922715 RepID=UPI001FAF060F|nr:RagB/SusD family nutrient uptake outer membrane protein [Parabacteroides sp. FAFU027]